MSAPSLPNNPANAQVGLGALIAIGPAVGTPTPTFVTIGQVSDIKQSGMSANEIKFQTLDYPSVQKLPGIPDQGTVDISFVRAPGLGTTGTTGDAGQRAAFAAANGPRVGYQFQLTLFVGEGQTTSGDVKTFNAIITKFNDVEDVSPDKVIEGSMTLSITSIPVVTPGS